MVVCLLCDLLESEDSIEDGFIMGFLTARCIHYQHATTTYESWMRNYLCSDHYDKVVEMDRTRLMDQKMLLRAGRN